MEKHLISMKQARQFMLSKHGLIGNYQFIGKKGILAFISQAGCIQFDPIDSCGRNPELVLQSRIRGFRKQMLYDLLYEDRALIDYFDKNLSIMGVDDWKHFSRYREAYQNRKMNRTEVHAVCDEIKSIIKTKGCISSADIGFNEVVSWAWNDTRLSRAALETMYFCGDLVVHHKKGAIKYYDLTEKCIPVEILQTPDPYPDNFEYTKWRVLRRIASVGLLWNKASDAWLGIWDLKADARGRIFDQLLSDRKIMEVHVEGIKDSLYCAASDAAHMKALLTERVPLKPRCEFLAPLDNLLWDRKLIKAIFDFDYKWEIYTPQAKRKYGFYVLPILYGDRLIGRIEAVNDRKDKKLIVKNIWFEDKIKVTATHKKAIDTCLKRFAAFNECSEMIREV